MDMGCSMNPFPQYKRSILRRMSLCFRCLVCAFISFSWIAELVGYLAINRQDSETPSSSKEVRTLMYSTGQTHQPNSVIRCICMQYGVETPHLICRDCNQSSSLQTERWQVHVIDRPSSRAYRTQYYVHTDDISPRRNGDILFTTMYVCIRKHGRTGSLV